MLDSKCALKGTWSVRPVVLFCLIALAASTGCEQEPQVYQYFAPTIQVEPTERLLGAITRSRSGTWFFKAQGPTKILEDHAAAFETMIRSLKFGTAEKDPITWTLPDGWSQVPADQIPDGQFKPFAILRFGDKKKPIDMTLTRFGPTQGGDLNANITRWQKKIGLHDHRAAAIQASHVQMDLPHGPVYLVNIAGPGQPTSDSSMRSMGQPKAHSLVGAGSANAGSKIFEKFKAALVYTTPDGWTELPNEQPGVLRQFVIESDGRRADLLIQAVPLETDAALMSHLNGYAKRLKLPAVSAQTLGGAIRPITVGNGGPQSGTLVDLSAPNNTNGLVVVLTNEAGFPTLFHLYGDANVVRRHKPILVAFCRSFWFRNEQRSR
jgi:hypothetical protein